MSKITLSTVGSIPDNPTTAATTINNNSTILQTAFDNTLSRDGTSPNQMGSNFDMNGFRILNLPAPTSSTDPVRLEDITSTTTVTVPGATLQVSPSDPTGATTEVMMGLGSTCHLATLQSTRIRICFQGQAQNASAGGVCSVQARFGTGTAPTNGSAVTGTVIGSKPHSLQSSANNAVMFEVGGIISGLTVGTSYWFDLAVSNIATGTTATVTNISCSAYEF